MPPFDSGRISAELGVLQCGTGEWTPASWLPPLSCSEIEMRVFALEARLAKAVHKCNYERHMEALDWEIRNPFAIDCAYSKKQADGYKDGWQGAIEFEF